MTPAEKGMNGTYASASLSSLARSSTRALAGTSPRPTRKRRCEAASPIMLPIPSW